MSASKPSEILRPTCNQYWEHRNKVWPNATKDHLRDDALGRMRESELHTVLDSLHSSLELIREQVERQGEFLVPQARWIENTDYQNGEDARDAARRYLSPSPQPEPQPTSLEAEAREWSLRMIDGNVLTAGPNGVVDETERAADIDGNEAMGTFAREACVRWLTAFARSHAEKVRGERDAEIAALTKMARDAIPDYPFDPNHKYPLREAVYGMTQSIEGLHAACDDLQARATSAKSSRDALLKQVEAMGRVIAAWEKWHESSMPWDQETKLARFKDIRTANKALSALNAGKKSKE